MNLNESRTELSHDSWNTPEHCLELVRKVFGGSIDLDPFTSSDNPTKAEFCLTGNCLEDDGFECPWFSAGPRNVFANPIYGRALRKFATKVVNEYVPVPYVKDNRQIITLTPCRPDTGWYDILIANANAVAEVRGRLKFKGYSPKAGKIIDNVPAQFPSVFLYFGYQPEYFCQVFSGLARCRVV